MKRLIVLFLFGLLFTSGIYSQLSSYNFLGSSTTYTAITGGTVLGTTANDEQVFNNNTTGEVAPQTDIGFPIGFNFTYNGTVYDKFAVSTNGYILLGTGSFPIGTTNLPISFSTTSGFANIISVFGKDLQGQSGSQLCYKLTGVTPNRVLTVQWLNYRRFNITGESFNFQIQLEEADNTVSFVYGNVTTTSTSTTNTIQVGLRGAANSDYKNRQTTTSWSASTAGTLNTHNMRHTTTVKPASGQKYEWTPAAMTYGSATTLNGGNNTYKKNSVNNVILIVPVVMNGSSSPLSATSFTFSTNGTTSISDISNARVWFTGASSVFSATQQFGSTVVNPNGSFTVNGSRVLVSGTNYFWLTYNVDGTAVTGNMVDGECNSFTVVSARIPTIQAPHGQGVITNAPLAGTYNIGLQMFNRVAGKELYYERSEKTVLREFPKEKDNSPGKHHEYTAEMQGTKQRELREVTEDVYTLMDGGFPYNGPSFIKITPEIRNRFPSGGELTDVSGVYANITEAFDDITYNGLDNTVEFLLVDELYSSETFPLTLSGLTSTSETKTFTLKPAPGVTPQIVMSSGSAVFKIFDSDFITIDGSNTAKGLTRDMSIISNYGFIAIGVWFASSSGRTCTDIELKNCIITTGENFWGSTPVIVSDNAGAFTPGAFNNISISNNVIQKGLTGIFVNGGSTSAGISDLTISGNLINSSGTDAIGSTGIYVSGVMNSTVSNNEVGNLSSTGAENDKGIWLANGSHNTKVEKNKISNIGHSGTGGNGGYGIYVTANHLNACDTISNNVIYNIFGDGWNFQDASYYLDNPIGIALYSPSPQSGICLLNNSINLFGNTLTKANSASFGVFVSTNTTISIFNNVLSNNLGESVDGTYGSIGIYLQGAANQLSGSDYNNYYINPTGTGEKVLGKIAGTTTSTTLGSWQGATLQDRSSLSYEPGFTSNTDLTPNINSVSVWSLNGRGKQFSSVNSDINGNPRSTTLIGGAPDLGAYEFTPVSVPLSITGTGAIINGGTTHFIFGGDTVASVIWHGTGLPSALTLKYYTGQNPPSPTSGSYGNCYWAFQPTGGTSYTFDLTLFWDPALTGGITGENKIKMANYTSNVWEHYDATVNTSLRRVTQTALTKLSTFTIDDEEGPLPVTLLYLNHLEEGRNVILKWATGLEINNKGFDIERSSEFDTEWKKIGFVNGQGNSNRENVYDYKDLGLNTGRYNYRLKQIDFSGAVEYYDLHANAMIGKPLSFGMGQNYPNPSNPTAKIEYQVPFDSKMSIKVYDIKGQEVRTLFQGFSEAGYHTVEFNGTGIASGIYFYRLQSEEYSKTMKLILVK